MLSPFGDEQMDGSHSAVHDSSQWTPSRQLASAAAWCHRYYLSLVVLLVVESACLAAFLADAVPSFTWASWFTLALLGIVLVLLVNDAPPEVVFLWATVVLRLTGVITEEQARPSQSEPDHARGDPFSVILNRHTPRDPSEPVLSTQRCKICSNLTQDLPSIFCWGRRRLRAFARRAS
jgi:hypothetical protein